ncbi:uncharacterized protein LOC132205078 [Neocloeon triangulifer]|uniref:uncharacterized protein LOC132205078 n=1 Tax=Neocloeon triangulifer TaxID=2078957 RepID=UPI00286EFC97|nr:uncharacterized protein LOC132205078 [Neocloeon triangulifer]
MAGSWCLKALFCSLLVAFSTCAPHVNKDARKFDSEAPVEPIADSQHVYPSFALPLGHGQPRQAVADPHAVPELIPDSQHYFPSFSSIFSNNPLGHSRPPVYDDPPTNHRPRHIPYALQQANSFDAFASTNKDKATSKEQPTTDHSVLGSGNFGVIKGGTFYEDDYDSGSSNDDFFYYGGGRPSYSYNYRPSHGAASNGDDFFANFRDFADITAPKQGAFSELHVVYANKNGTLADVPAGGAPRNIFEQLQQLEQKPPKKVSKSKNKLTKYQQKEASKVEWKKLKFQQSPKDYMYQEPLLALS